jgi:hypothetical protein
MIIKKFKLFGNIKKKSVSISFNEFSLEKEVVMIGGGWVYTT